MNTIIHLTDGRLNLHLLCSHRGLESHLEVAEWQLGSKTLSTHLLATLSSSLLIMWVLSRGTSSKHDMLSLGCLVCSWLPDPRGPRNPTLQNHFHSPSLTEVSKQPYLFYCEHCWWPVYKLLCSLALLWPCWHGSLIFIHLWTPDFILLCISFPLLKLLCLASWSQEMIAS